MRIKSIVYLFILLFLTTCKKAPTFPPAAITLREPLRVERTAPDTYTLHFQQAGAYQIFTGPDQDHIDWTTVYATAKEPTVLLKGFEAGRRYFFGVVNEKNDTLIASERRLTFAGVQNFRDLGGLPARDGRHVKWGLFYRSGSLYSLQDNDHTYFKTLGIRSVVDFRTPYEVKEEPDNLPKDTGLQYANVSIQNDEDVSNIKDDLLNGKLTAASAHLLLVKANQDFAGPFANRYVPFLQTLSDQSRLPMVYHCTAGKDRAGFATFLVLSCLGVQEETILNDYLMTNYYSQEANQKILNKAGLGSVFMRNLDPEAMVPLLEAKHEYLQEAISTIHQRYGSIDSFLVKEYGITDSVRKEWVRRYTY